MMMLRLLAVSTLLLGAPALASTQAHPSPKPWLEAQIEEARRLADRRVEVDSPKAEAWKQDAEALIDAMVDWDALIQGSLGSRWKKIDDEQQKAFFDLMKRLIKASYQSKLKLALEEKDSEPRPKAKVRWLEETLEDDDAHVVAQVRSGKDRMDLEFDLTWHGDQWKMTDLAIDGASTVRLYRTSFRKVIREEGWDGLMSRLEKKLEDVQSGRADFGLGSNNEASGDKAKPAP